MRLILASASPRRRELMERAGYRFEVIPSPAEEIHDHSMPPALLCETNAAIKARDIASKHPEATVIGADTLVFIDDRALGKPRDLDESRFMLGTLSGRTHFVCTGVCIIRPGRPEHRLHEITEVSFRTLDTADIDAYLACTNTLDKAGAYGIQDHGDRLIASIEGSFENVMGLPIGRVLAEIPIKSGCPDAANP